MALHDPSPKLTYDDYALIPDDGQRHEIIDGEHYVTPAPRISHQRSSNRLSSRMTVFVERHDLGEIFVAPCDVVLSEHDIVEPDILFVSKERAGIITEDNIQGAPDLVVEILSEATRRRDQGIKRERYERFGVGEYWLVDPFRKTATVHLRTEHGFRQAAVLSAEAGDVLTTRLLPGLTIPLTEIFG
jgi:Uma2 family endonuclease